MQELEEMAQGGPRQYLNSPFLLEGDKYHAPIQVFQDLAPPVES